MYAVEDTVVAIGAVTIDTVLVDMDGLYRCFAQNQKARYICKDHESLFCDDCHFDDHRTLTDIHKIHNAGLLSYY